MTIALHILTILRTAGDLLTPEEQIRSDLRLGITPPPTRADANEAFRTIEDRDLAISIRDHLDDRIRWRITDKGRGELAARGL